MLRPKVVDVCAPHAASYIQRCSFCAFLRLVKFAGAAAGAAAALGLKQCASFSFLP
jgi:hypothetical protein